MVVARELINFGAVKRLDLLEILVVAACDKVDRGAFATPATASANPVEIGIAAFGHIKINDGANLLDIDAARGDVG